MNILLVEDSTHKRDKIIMSLGENINLNIKSVASYNSAICEAKRNIYDLMILDMSMPTFDKTLEEHGGDFRVFGGIEIIEKLEKYNKLTAFVILTSFSNFNNKTVSYSLDDISAMLSKCGNLFKGVIYYSASSSDWAYKLDSIIKEIISDKDFSC